MAEPATPAKTSHDSETPAHGQQVITAGTRPNFG
jgi:hypothetical protein